MNAESTSHRGRDPYEVLFSPLTFKHGPSMKNRFMLAPMTNQQSNEDGSATAEEISWLEHRARGGFALVNTCCSHVTEPGKGFPGELGVFDDELIPGLTRIAEDIHRHGALANVQLYHGGARALRSRVSSVADPSHEVRALETNEIEAMIEAFVEAALRTEQAGFDGVQLHAAHGYLLSQFLSKELNSRRDQFGGSPEGRSRMLFDVIDRVRERCSENFQVGVRLSVERFGQDLFEILAVAQRIFDEDTIDYVDFSLWDVHKESEDSRVEQGILLRDLCLGLDRKNTRVGLAGKIIGPADALDCIEAGADFVSLGKVAILNHDYPNQLERTPDYEPTWRPVSRQELGEEGLGKKFIDYLSTYTHPAFSQLDPTVPPEEQFDINSYVAGKH